MAGMALSVTSLEWRRDGHMHRARGASICPTAAPPLTLGQVVGVRAQPGRSARGGAVFPGGAFMAGTRPLQL